MSKSLKNIFSGSVWGILAKIVDAAAKFFTIPMLVGFYGKNDYGLIALAFSLNAYLRLMDLGMNIGCIRFFSIWISKKEWFKISKVSQSSIVFYGVIGIINAIIFVIMAYYAGSFFKLTPEQYPIFKWIMYILALSTVFNWTSNVISQLLSAHSEVAWVNKVTVVSSVLNFVTAFLAIKLKLGLPVYFLLYTLSTMVIIPLNIYRLSVYNMKLSSLLAPVWHWEAFKEILGYSAGIFTMGIFQFTANNLRPLLLSKYASKGISVLTDFRIIQTVAVLIMAIGAVILQVLLPPASKMYAENDTVKMDKMIYIGTKYVSIFISFVVFLLCADSFLLLNLYMGNGYGELSLWLIIWLLTLLLTMHILPIESIVLSSGKTKFLAYSSAISCVLSLPITVILAKQYNVGSAVIGYFVYTFLQIAFYYVYYIPRILKKNSLKIFLGSFFPSVLIGVVCWVLTYYLNKLLTIKSDFVRVFINSSAFTVVFSLLTITFVMRPKEIKEMKQSILG